MGNSTLAVDPVNVGDALVLSVGIAGAYAEGVTVVSVSGGGSTWQRLTADTDTGSGINSELWMGTVTTTGNSTITVTYSVNASLNYEELAAQEYSSAAGASTTWSVVAFGQSNHNTASTTVTFPSLTASTSGELYVGYSFLYEGAGVAGSTSGVTYDVTSANNLYVYDTNVTGTLSPTASASPAAQSVSAGAVIEAMRPASPSLTTTDSMWDPVAGGSIPLNINDATTSGSSTTNVSYIYGDLLFGGTAPIEQITTTASGSTAVFLVANQTGVQGVFSSSGATDELAVYSPYGKQTIKSGSDVTPYGFQSSYTDATGLIYLVNRYFDPATDQFLSIDPLVSMTGQPYAFTNDNPLNATDPSGAYARALSGGTLTGNATFRIPNDPGLTYIVGGSSSTVWTGTGTVTTTTQLSVSGPATKGNVTFSSDGSVSVGIGGGVANFSAISPLSSLQYTPGSGACSILPFGGSCSYSVSHSAGDDTATATYTIAYQPTPKIGGGNGLADFATSIYYASGAYLVAEAGAAIWNYCSTPFGLRTCVALVPK
jgi:RHS repeat-associated protein